MNFQDKESDLKKKIIEKYNKKLLDISSRNRFINFKFQKKLRIIDENPEIIYQKILKKEKFFFITLGDAKNNIKDEETREFQIELSKMKFEDDDYLEFKKIKNDKNLSYTKFEIEELKALNNLKDKVRQKLGMQKIVRENLTETEYAKKINLNPNFELDFDNKEKKHEDNQLQVIHFSNKFADICKKIFMKYNTFMKETGNNPLYLCFGFLEWEHKKNKTFHSPILIFQIKMTEEKNRYCITSEGEDLENNFFIIKKLEADHDIFFPKWKKENENIDLEKSLQKYYQEVEEILKNKAGFKFKLKNQIAISTFDNTNMYIWKDFRKISDFLEKNEKLYQLLTSRNENNNFNHQNINSDNQNQTSQNQNNINSNNQNNNSNVQNLIWKNNIKNNNSKNNIYNIKNSFSQNQKIINSNHQNINSNNQNQNSQNQNNTNSNNQNKNDVQCEDSKTSKKCFTDQELEIIKSLPFEYDSSQFKIIKKVLQGQDLVIQGPPGTGKSQTICNLIAALSKQNKKILFVAQKEAALNVVKNKLNQKNYGDFMLNIFSEKANKKKILISINKRWRKNFDSQKESNLFSDFFNNYEHYNNKIFEISEYLEYLNHKNEGKISNFDLIWKKVKKFDVSLEEKWIKELLNLIPNINQNNDLIEQEKDLDTIIKKFNDLNQWKNYFKNKTLYKEIKNSNLNEKDIFEKINKTNRWLNDLELEKLSDHDIYELQNLEKKFNKIFSVSLEKKIDILISIFKDQKINFEQIFNYLNLAKQINDDFEGLKNKVNSKKYLKNLKIEILALNEFKTTIKNSNFFNHAFSKKIKNEYQNLNFKKNIWTSRKETLKVIKNVICFYKKNYQKDEQDKKLSWDSWIYEILNCQNNQKINLLNLFFKKFKTTLSNTKKLNYFIFIFLKKEINNNFKTFWKFDQTIINKIFIKDDSEILKIIKEFFSDIQMFDFWIDLKKISETLNCKIIKFIKIFIEKMCDKISNLKEMKYFFSFLIKEKNNQILKENYENFNTEILKKNLNEIKNLDQKIIENSFQFFEMSQKKLLNLNRLNLRELEHLKSVNIDKKAKNIANFKGWELLKEIRNKKRTRISIRHIFENALENLLLMKPIFLMSSTAAAKFLPNRAKIFDVVIIDEASQMLTEHAISSIYRAKQIVIVGDKKQLPPTSFFKAKDIESFDHEESILELAEKIFSKEMLLFHYRSNHEDLINFSNNAFYENKLQIPSTSRIGSSVVKKFYLANAFYQGKIKDSNEKAGINKIEAETLIKHVTETIEENPNQSIGIVTMNSAQKKYLTEIFYGPSGFKYQSQKVIKYLEKWQEKNGGIEEFFIKNIENVQGDERDIIYISTVYGKSEKINKVYQRFGPISSDGGERRLNVLFTRAKNKIFLFTSLRPGDIVEKETEKEGTRSLRNFLIYTEKTIKFDHKLKIKQSKNDFHEIIASWLKEEGFTCEFHIGQGAFLINIAVKHPQIKNNYLLAIESDGPEYHDLSYYRDRDVLKNIILNQKYGWNFYNIWSRDYFENPEKIKIQLLKKCHQRLQELKE